MAMTWWIWSITSVMMVSMMGGCDMHHLSKGYLLRTTNVSLIDAVKTAEASVTNGRAVEAELEHKNGRTVYEVEVIDGVQIKHKVDIDAGTGKVTPID
jgi:uncharacterized membrane protein YkoI